MYSGHLPMMLGLYEMFYRDGRFDAPGSLTFQFHPVFRGMGPEDFSCDHDKLAEVIFAEFERNDFIGCECEPNGIFVYCNQFAILGFMHYDHTHGTDLAARTVPLAVPKHRLRRRRASAPEPSRRRSSLCFVATMIRTRFDGNIMSWQPNVAIKTQGKFCFL